MSDTNDRLGLVGTGRGGRAGHSRWLGGPLAALAVLLAVLGAPGAENAAVVEARILQSVRYLADDALEGRGIRTQGIAKAADYLRHEFRRIGLASPKSPNVFGQSFKVRVDTKVDLAKTALVLRAPDGQRIVLESGKDFQPLAHDGPDRFAGPIVFAGYGISAEKLPYDDYQGIDVAGKVVLLLRREPQQADPKSVFDGTKTTAHAGITAKAQNALAHKAAAVLMVSDPFSVKTPADDKLLAPNYLGNENVALPMAHITQELANRLLAATELGTLGEVEARIDKDLKPVSKPIAGWSVEGRFTFERVDAALENVIGVLEGQGPNADETIVIGAHYDHLGFGGAGSLAGVSNQIHNGADDNASGTAALLELARRFASRGAPPKRRLVFIAFSAEEVGLRGSRHYVKEQPLYPLDKTIAMVNFDMVGRLEEDRLTVFGVKTAKEFDPLIDSLGKRHGFTLKTIGGGNGPSDHASFYQANVPVIHLFTGTHQDYHRPSDDVDKINGAGIRRIVDFAEDFLNELVELPQRPQFVKVKDEDPHAGLEMRRGDMVYLGTIPDYNDENNGVLLNDVKEGSPAHKAGMQKGDVLIEIAGMPIKNARGLAFALRKHQPNETVDVVVLRHGQKQSLKVTFVRRP